MSPEHLARAEAHGLVRDPIAHRWWHRGALPTVALLARADDGRWWWAPETWKWGDVARSAPRFDTEAEALSAALDWLDAGEPEVVP